MKTQNTAMDERMMRSVLRLRMQRQGLTQKLEEEAYHALFRDSQPGQNVYWHGFGQPPVLSLRAAFDDMAYNAQRQRERRLVKGRYQGGNLGWVLEEDLELFAGLSRKPIAEMTLHQELVYRTICDLGPLNIQQLKQETGLLVRELTPALHRLQEAFLLYEDQYDGEWDRPWMRFEEMFPEVSIGRYTRQQALEALLLRYARRMVFFTSAMAKDFYRVPERECRAAAASLCGQGRLIASGDGYMLPEDAAQALDAPPLPGGCAACGVIVMHRNDMLVKSFEHQWKPLYKQYAEQAAARFPDAAGFEVLQLLLIDGEIHGAALGKFKYGPYIIEDIAVDEAYADRRGEIIAAVRRENPGSRIARYTGRTVDA